MNKKKGAHINRNDRYVCLKIVLLLADLLNFCNKIQRQPKSINPNYFLYPNSSDTSHTNSFSPKVLNQIYNKICNSIYQSISGLSYSFFSFRFD